MRAEQEAAKTATKFRQTHSLGNQPLADLVTLIERTTGVDVAVIDASADSHGMTAHDPESGATFIAVAKTDHPMRQRSTLAHELGHHLFRDREATKDGHWDDRDPCEIRADAFARHVLVPMPAVKEFLSTVITIGEQDLSNIVQWFGVSPAMAAIAMRHAGTINDETKNRWRHLFSPTLAARYGWIDQYQTMQASANQRRSPQKLLARAIRGYSEGVVGVPVIARLSAIDETLAHAILESGQACPGDGAATWAGADTLPDVEVDLSDLEDAPGSVE